jgi:hypothetical protein
MPGEPSLVPPSKVGEMLRLLESIQGASLRREKGEAMPMEDDDRRMEMTQTEEIWKRYIFLNGNKWLGRVEGVKCASVLWDGYFFKPNDLRVSFACVASSRLPRAQTERRTRFLVSRTGIIGMMLVDFKIEIQQQELGVIGGQYNSPQGSPEARRKEMPRFPAWEPFRYCWSGTLPDDPLSVGAGLETDIKYGNCSWVAFTALRHTGRCPEERVGTFERSHDR